MKILSHWLLNDKPTGKFSVVVVVMRFFNLFAVCTHSRTESSLLSVFSLEQTIGSLYSDLIFNILFSECSDFSAGCSQPELVTLMRLGCEANQLQSMLSMKCSKTCGVCTGNISILLSHYFWCSKSMQIPKISL